MVASVGAINNSKGYKMLEESISANKDNAGRCSEASPTHVAQIAACIRCGKVAQRNHWNYFILPCCITLLQPSENKPLSSPTSLQEQNRN